MIIMKFGGTSVKDSSAINTLTGIVKSRLHRKPVIVCSAVSGITDALSELGIKASAGNITECNEILEFIRNTHLQIIQESIPDLCKRKNALEIVNDLITELKDISSGISLLSELSDRSLAKILSFGEILSTTMITEILNANGIESQLLDARKFIKTNYSIRNAEPDFESICREAPFFINPVIENRKTVVTQGFIGSNSADVTTVFSRGGSDLSASLIGMAMNAEEIEIWTDVDGILSGDPKLIRNPLSIKEISFKEASELASFGAKVLHPSTIHPASEKNIPVRILNSFNPEFTGTLISNNTNIIQSPVKSVTCKRDISVLNIYNPKTLHGHGFLRKVLEVFEKHRVEADLITTSKINVSITIDDNELINDLTDDLSKFSCVEIDTGKSQVCIVGNNLKNTKGIETQVFNELGGFNITLISQGASLINFSFVVEREELDPVMRILHKRFFED